MVLLAFIVGAALGFGAGRVHSVSGLKAKIAMLESTLKADEAIVIAKLKVLLKLS